MIADEADFQKRAVGSEKGAKVSFGHGVKKISGMKLHAVSPV
jgi:hypothetical protein